jgi:hypothetical protein
VWLGHWYATGAWAALQTFGIHEFAAGIDGLPASLVDAQKKLKVYEQSGIPLRLMLKTRTNTSTNIGSVAAPPNPNSNPNPNPHIASGPNWSVQKATAHSNGEGSCTYPATNCVDYPPCELGGSTQPVVKQHRADTQMPPALSPGRIEESGEVMNAGQPIYRNITIRGNVVLHGGRFLDAGGATGLVVRCAFFGQGFTLEDVISSHAFSLEALACA